MAFQFRLEKQGTGQQALVRSKGLCRCSYISKNAYASHKTSGEGGIGKVGVTELNAQVRKQRPSEGLCLAQDCQ